VDDARVDEPRFFAPCDDFNRKAERGFGFGQKLGDVFGNAEGVGCHRAHLLGRKAAQPLAKLGKAFQGAGLAFFV